MRRNIGILLFLGLLVRLIFIPAPGFEADIAYWKSWSLAAAEKGVVWLTQNTNYNYPAGFTLVLWLIGKIYHLFADPDNFQQYWQARNYLFLLLAKLPSILADLAIAAGIYYLLRRPKLLDLPKRTSKLAFWLTSVYLFHPVAIYDGAWWGQVDSVGVLFVLLSLIFLGLKKPTLASILTIIGFLLKLQTIIFLPLFFLFIWRAFGWQKMVKGLAASVMTFLIITLPFLFASDLARTFYLVIQNADWFPLLSLRAYNFWWLVSWASGMETSDKILTLGVTSAKTAGLILFSATYFLTCILVFLRPILKNLLIASTIAAFAFFLFPTQGHERYIFPALILSVLWIPLFWENQKGRWFSLVFFIILSVNTLLNLNISMVINYPANGLPLLSNFTHPIFSLIISAVNLGLFALAFFILILRKLPCCWWGAAMAIIIIGFGLTNLGYLTLGRIWLTQLRPISFEQSYGWPQFNMNVNSFLGPKNWSFLSVNYYFYRRGIGTHANSKIAYDLGGKIKKLSTDYGLDSEAAANASVIFQIYGDDSLLFTSPKVTKFDLPRSTEVPLNGVKTLTLVVNDAGDGIYGDHANWLAPTLYR